uniref:Integrase catalytic domain-containing protein n=1 Tax=Musca domestica TaxID=7370 RepID=A0A1I8NKV1_MUSDO
YHKFTAPYDPATNGQAQRSVQTVKNALKAMCTTKVTLKENLNEILRQYRNAPHSTTGQSPAQLFLGRQLRTRLDLVRPQETSSKVTAKQFMKSSRKYTELERDQNVYFLSGNLRISKGKVTKRLGDVHILEVL